MRIYKCLIVLQVIAIVTTSHAQNAKARRILQEVEDELIDDDQNIQISDIHHNNNNHNHNNHKHHHKHNGRALHGMTNNRRPHHNRWNSRRKSGPMFTPWTAWTQCDKTCKKSRERYCKVKRRCGHTKHIEEKKCPKASCHQHYTNIFHHQLELVTPGPVLNPTLTPVLPKHFKYQSPQTAAVNDYHRKRQKLQVYEEVTDLNKNNKAADGAADDDDDDGGDYFVLKKPKSKRYHKKRKPIMIEVDDYEDLEDEDDSDSDLGSFKYNKKFIKSIRTKKWHRQDDQKPKATTGIWSNGQRQGKRKDLNQFDWDGGFEYEDQNLAPTNNEYNYEEYDDDVTTTDLRNTTAKIPPPRERAVYEPPPKHRRAYSKWSAWTKCSPKCTTRRYKKCRLKEMCGKEILREIAYCFTEGSFCEQWLQNQARKTEEARPIATSRKDVIATTNTNENTNTNSVVNDYIMNGKGYRGPEYQPMRLKCGIAPIRSNKRNMYNLLKIIGGRASRKGEWPWQAVIFNRFKEAFCGGTLIAPNWILTAAHCVRKVLYVRLGEHNLDIEDGTEVEYRVVKSIKHPKYDKKTVDSDIALLRLPRAVNASTWIGFSCLPKPFQKLPKNIQCTVIGWGKRRNRDQAGTSLLQNAEVPIISMDNCKTVYHDYTITNNMFCAGHKRGRIDTCAGDSGGPLLCRDSTKRNHPWTIFGITSFGDGCAKRNKFGIYTKVTNYVDWIWSVVNCNGNCKPNTFQRRY